jgi:hypothetical protein
MKVGIIRCRQTEDPCPGNTDFKMGAEAIVLASCISLGTPIGMACPHFAAMCESIRKAVGPEIALIDYTH